MRVTLSLTVAIAIAAGGAAYSAPAPVDACALLTKDELRPFIKHPDFDKAPAERYGTASGSTCSYPGVAIQMYTYPLSTYESTWSKDKANVEQVPGLGDAALLHRNAQAVGVEIAVRKGQRTFAALVDLAQGESMDAAKTRAIGHARAAVAKLR
jgi:hypothetical protein